MQLYMICGLASQGTDNESSYCDLPSTSWATFHIYCMFLSCNKCEVTWFIWTLLLRLKLHYIETSVQKYAFSSVHAIFCLQVRTSNRVNIYSVNTGEREAISEQELPCPKKEKTISQLFYVSWWLLCNTLC